MSDKLVHKLPDTKIDKDDPWLNDKLFRKPEAENLIQLITSISESQPFVLATNSPWGTGKTTFLRMWNQSLLNDKYPCIFFNAWENDFVDDPLVSFIGEIQKYVDDVKYEKKGTKNKVRKIWDKSKDIGGKLIKTTAPHLAKFALQRILGFDPIKDLTEFEDLTDDQFSEIASKLTEETISSYVKQKDTLNDFRINLASFVKVLSEDGEESRPLIIFIDELDRCRPTYAIELLERIKHLFNVPGIVFVLALDMEQLAHSVKTLYGSDMDADGYLRRFIDLEYTLNQPSTEMFCNFLYEKFNFKEIGTRQEIVDSFKTFSEVFRLSLRTIAQCFSIINIVLKINKNSQSWHLKYYPIFLVTLKARNQNLYQQFNSRAIDAEEVIKYIEKMIGDREFQTPIKYLKIIKAIVLSSYQKSNIAYYTSKLKIAESNNDIFEINKYQNYIELLKEYNKFLSENLYDVDVHQYWVDQIEFTKRFKI